jgi:sulfide dehydrogenase cytochrome subunit
MLAETPAHPAGVFFCAAPELSSTPHPEPEPRMSLRTAFLLAAAALAADAAAQQPASPSFAAPNVSERGGRAMASNSAPCHGTEGRPVAGSNVARLAGEPAVQIVEKMKAFSAGKAEATVMHQIAKGYGEAETAALARYFASQKP